MPQHYYFYYYTPNNFRRAILIPEQFARTSNRKLCDIEGLFICDKEVKSSDLDFSILREDEIIKKYSGKFHKFGD